MNFIYKILLACSLLLPLSACAPKTLPAWQGEALTVQFSARVMPQATELPVQGGLRMTQDGGTLGLILQHGRTLGQCRFDVQEKKVKPDAEALPNQSLTNSPRKLRMHCRAAEGVGSAGQSLLQRVALAVYHALPTLTVTSPVTPATSPQALQRFVYEDSLGSVDIVFSEVRKP